MKTFTVFPGTRAPLSCSSALDLKPLPYSRKKKTPCDSYLPLHIVH